MTNRCAFIAAVRRLLPLLLELGVDREKPLERRVAGLDDIHDPLMGDRTVDRIDHRHLLSDPACLSKKPAYLLQPARERCEAGAVISIIGQHERVSAGMGSTT
jgi:hypothetical protein